jgi:Kdo2-lipid IVA lauroyltransferase/acyltransferase
MKVVLTFKDKVILFPLWLLTKLPLRLLYFISDILFLITYYVVRYRRKIVFQNIGKSFPDKSEIERKIIIRKFYHYLCDYFIESIYMINMNLEECNKRYTFENPEVIERLYVKKKNIILATSHFGNWEWASNLSVHIPYEILGIYKPLSNKLFDRLFIHIRGKYGSLPVAMNKTLRVVMDYLSNEKPFALYLVSDQRPSPEDLSFWTNFLNQETPIITGTDRLAKKYDLAVVFLEIDRVKRGYYKIHYRLITDNPKTEAPNSINEKYIRTVEQMILKRPELWLWSHNRWKYNPQDYKPKMNT